MRLSRTLCVLCVVGMAFQAKAQGWHTTPSRIEPFGIRMEPVLLPHKAGLGEMRITITPYQECPEGEELTASVLTKGGLALLGPETWPVQQTEDSAQTVSLQFSIPPGDTSSLGVRVRCGHLRRTLFAWFITTGDTLEYWRSDPEYYVPQRKLPELDTTRYRIRLDLRDKEHYEFFERYKEQLGPLEPTEDSGFYIYRTTREHIKEFLIEGFKLEPVDSIPNMPTRPPRVKPTRQHDSSTPRSQPPPPTNQVTFQTHLPPASGCRCPTASRYRMAYRPESN